MSNTFSVFTLLVLVVLYGLVLYHGNSARNSKQTQRKSLILAIALGICMSWSLRSLYIKTENQPERSIPSPKNNIAVLEKTQPGDLLICVNENQWNKYALLVERVGSEYLQGYFLDQKFTLRTTGPGLIITHFFPDDSCLLRKFSNEEQGGDAVDKEIGGILRRGLNPK